MNTIKGDILFDELATILRNEVAQIQMDEGEVGISATKVLLTTQKTFPYVPSPQSHDHEASGFGPGSQMLQAGSPGFSMYISNLEYCWTIFSTTVKQKHDFQWWL